MDLLIPGIHLKQSIMKNIRFFKNHFFLYLLIIGLITPAIYSCTNCPENDESNLPTQEESKTAILEKIEMANDKWADGDPMGFVEVAANDVTWMDDLAAQFPVSGKDALSAYLENFKGQIPAHEHVLSDFAFQFYDDIVIVTYRYTGTFDGVPANPWKVTAVYKYEDGDWLSVHENWTVVKKEE